MCVCACAARVRVCMCDSGCWPNGIYFQEGLREFFPIIVSNLWLVAHWYAFKALLSVI